MKNRTIVTGIIEAKGLLDSMKRVYDPQGLAPTLSTMQGGERQPKIMEDSKRTRIRKVTPKECWRLMGFSDDDFNKAQAVNSNTQLYKQAGNSIVVNVLEAIFSQMLEENKK